MVERVYLKYLLFIGGFFLCPSHGCLQNIDYCTIIKPIIDNKCVHCHYQNGPAPFALEKYEDIKKRAKFIAYVTQIKYMPPWKSDENFAVHRNPQVLSQNEIGLIQSWVSTGAKKGKCKENRSSVYAEYQKGNNINIDRSTEYRMTAPYLIPNDRRDDFRFFYIPCHLDENKFITGISFQAGNKKRVHHSRIMIDTTGLIQDINGMSELDPNISFYQRFPLADEFLYGWVPGNFSFKFPKGFGKKIHKNANIILNMHYSPSSLSEFDTSSIRFEYRSEQEVTREVYTLILRENDISNQPFFIPADDKVTFYMSSGVIESDISILTVQPHAHLLGKSFRAFAITEAGDLIPLIKIDDWDFNWQMTYEFPKLIHVPKGSVILMEGTYDNTVENPSNPNNPPKDTGYGWRTIDEMMNLIMYYVPYKHGDENLTLSYE